MAALLAGDCPGCQSPGQDGSGLTVSARQIGRSTVRQPRPPIPTNRVSQEATAPI
jgi:hypothetical protein